MTDPGYSLNLRTPALQLPDFFASMSAMNQAAVVSLREEGIISADLAARIGQAVAEIVEREAQPGARRSQDYLDFERDLLTLAGAEASWVHVGRSRQDMLSTGVHLWLRAAHLALFEDLLTLQTALLRLPRDHVSTVIPTYTHGVQAQPTSFAQYALAFASALDRIADRIKESYARANRSPLGAGVGTTSAFHLNRLRLAELLGFDTVVENAFDANLVAPIESALELCGILSLLAVQIGQLLADLYAPFYLSDSWISIDPQSRLTGISSMMPQKRNPRILEPLREDCSVIIGSAQSMSLLAHNIISGMSDVRETVTTVVPIARTHDLLVLLTRTLDALVIDPKRSLAEVNREYSAMTNLAEFLVQRANVPFREAHEFASHLTDFGRRRGLAPTQIAFSDASSVYRETLGVDLPLSSSEFAAALDPAAIVAGRAGLGGPQPDEVRRMMSAAESNLDAHGAWLGERRERLTSATTRLESEFREACAAVEV